MRLNGDTLEALVRARLISLPQLDSQLALAVEATNYSSVFLAMQLLQVRAAAAAPVSDCDCPRREMSRRSRRELLHKPYVLVRGTVVKPCIMCAIAGVRIGTRLCCVLLLQK